MTGSIKKKAIHGTIWSFIERFSVQIVQFVITIIMARILTPSDYGLIGMLAIFMSLSQVFIDGGFSSALIQRKNRTDIDFCTVFYINMGVSLVIYALLFACSPLIAQFYKQPLLVPILRVYSINLIINALGAVQRTILTIRIDFKTQSKITLSAAILSGIIGISSAYLGYGVWALVFQYLTMSVTNVVLFFHIVKWHPSLKFSRKSFHNLFGFGSKLLIATCISAIYDNLYNIVIGKKFQASDLGYYTRAQQFTTLLSTNVSAILARVSYPLLSQVQDDNERLIGIYKRYIQVSSFIMFPMLMILCGVAKPLVQVLLTEKWLYSVPLLQILSLAYMWNSIISINLNLLKVKGRSDLVLRLEIIKKSISVSILFLSLLMKSLEFLCAGMVLSTIIAVYINTYYTDKFLGYGFFRQIKDFGVYLGFALIIGLEGIIITHLISSPILSLALGLLICVATYFILCIIFKVKAISEVKDILITLRKG